MQIYVNFLFNSANRIVTVIDSFLAVSENRTKHPLVFSLQKILPFKILQHF